MHVVFDDINGVSSTQKNCASLQFVILNQRFGFFSLVHTLLSRLSGSIFLMHTNSVSVIIPFWYSSDSMELESSLKLLLPELSLIGEVILVYDGLSPISVEYFAPTFEKCDSDPLMSDLFF